jgi:general secretion pathway protein L
MQHASRRILLRLGDEELDIFVHEAGALQHIDVLSLGANSNVQRQQINDLLNERELTEVSRDLLLSESRVLRKEVILPLAAESNLRQALAFEMDRQTPFHVNEVFFDYRVIQRERDSAQLRVDLAVTQKSTVMREIELLGPLGLAPGGVDVEIDGMPAGLNLLPPDLRHRVVNRRSRLNLMAAAIAVVLLVFLMAQSVWLRQHQINEVEQAIEGVREEAMKVQELRKRIGDASEAAGFLQERRSTALPTVQVLAEVTRILPDDTYLDRLIIDSESVQMQGKSQNAQQLIEMVNSSPNFDNASFRGPTRLDTRTQKEIFDITATLVIGSDG